jgi:hypothetical protein
MNYSSLVKAINVATTELQSRAAPAVNQALILRNWLVGAYIVEYDQAGKDRAKFGTMLLETLATDLKAKEVVGLHERMLRNCRFTYLTYPQIRLSLTAEFEGRLLTHIPEKPIRLSLCSDRENAVVEYSTAGLDNNLFVSRYLTALPSVEKLQAFLEADRDRIESLMPAPAPAKKKTARKKKSVR